MLCLLLLSHPGFLFPPTHIHTLDIARRWPKNLYVGVSYGTVFRLQYACLNKFFYVQFCFMITVSRLHMYFRNANIWILSSLGRFLPCGLWRVWAYHKATGLEAAYRFVHSFSWQNYMCRVSDRVLLRKFDINLVHL